jgi:endogenous inhibitor of DNA gyrase (YacG/DUF329 family)
MRANQCDCCGGKFGMVTRSSWSRRFCSNRCKQVYRVQQGRSMRWADSLARHVERALERLKSTIQNLDWASRLPNAGS